MTSAQTSVKSGYKICTAISIFDWHTPHMRSAIRIHTVKGLKTQLEIVYTMMLVDIKPACNLVLIQKYHPPEEVLQYRNNS